MVHKSYNIVLLPPKSIADKAIDQSKKLAEQFPVNFVLESGKRNPHITLYQLELPVDNIKKVITVLAKIARSTQKLKIKMNKKTNYEEYIFWACPKTKGLQKLHKEIVKAINPLRRKKMVEKYGYTLALDEFLPHITLTNAINVKDVPSVLKVLKLERQEGIFDTIAITTLGPFGTVPKILKKFKLA